MRHEFTRAVKRAAYARSGGICEADSCFQILARGRFTYDHIITAFDGGRGTLDNCQVICRECDREKTRKDQSNIAHTRRLADREIGATAPRRRIPHRVKEPATPQRRATGGVQGKSMPPRRTLYVTEGF